MGNFSFNRKRNIVELDITQQMGKGYQKYVVSCKLDVFAMFFFVKSPFIPIFILEMLSGRIEALMAACNVVFFRNCV